MRGHVLASVLALQCFRPPYSAAFCCHPMSDGCWDQVYTRRLCCPPEISNETATIDAISCHPALVSTLCDRVARDAMSGWGINRPFSSEYPKLPEPPPGARGCYDDEELCLVLFVRFWESEVWPRSHSIEHASWALMWLRNWRAPVRQSEPFPPLKGTARQRQSESCD